MSFSGKIAVVTGGASGIGAACCRMLAARGAKVAVTNRALARAEALAREISGVALALDVATQAANEAAAAEIEARLGPVEILVTSAGVLQRPLRAEDLPETDIHQVVNIDQIGTYLSAVGFGARMARRGSGAIVTIASISGSRGLPLHAYAPAKAAVIEMTRCLAGEWGRSGVRVNSVSPGFTMTPAMGAAIQAGERDPRLLEETSALGRMITTEDVAEAVCFLASDAARAITGIDLPVDAGWLVAPAWASYGGLPPARRNAG